MKIKSNKSFLSKLCLAVSVGALPLFTACGISSPPEAELLAQDTGSQSVRGKSAEILFNLLKSSGIKEDPRGTGPFVRRVPKYSAETLHCAIAMTVNQDRSCEIEKNSNVIEIGNKQLVDRAVDVLKSLKAEVDQELFGAINYEVKNLQCFGETAFARGFSCSYNLRKKDSQKPELELSGKQAEILFDAMESAGIEPSLIDGQVIYGATNLDAESAHCARLYDVEASRKCEFTVKGVEKEVRSAALARSLTDLMDRLGAAVNPDLIGAINYEVQNISCSKPTIPQPQVTCSLKLVK